jgi:hypothetical protein
LINQVYSNEFAEVRTKKRLVDDGICTRRRQLSSRLASELQNLTRANHLKPGVLRCTEFKSVEELLSAAGVDSLSDLADPEYVQFIEQHFKCSDWKSLIKHAIMLQD